ncbi:MAG: porin family protein [Gemmatimonadota bacterium]|nr:porin family protein [Gemmatimonadota bacterium]
MRKQLVALIALGMTLIPAGAAQAQYGFGVIAGVSRSAFTGAGSTDVPWRTSALAGALVEIPTDQILSLRMELYVATKGSPQVRTGLGDGLRQDALKLAYLQLPVLVQLQTPVAVPLRSRTFFGVSSAVPVRCKVANQSCSGVDHFRLVSYDFGLLFGAEIDFRGLGIGARYEAGMTSVLPAATGGEVRNGTLAFTVRYTWAR